MSLSYSWVLSIVASDFSTASNAFFSASSDISFAFLYASSDVFIAEAILISALSKRSSKSFRSPANSLTFSTETLRLIKAYIVPSMVLREITLYP